jgi:hypothetical protein
MMDSKLKKTQELKKRNMVAGGIVHQELKNIPLRFEHIDPSLRGGLEHTKPVSNIQVK